MSSLERLERLDQLLPPDPQKARFEPGWSIPATGTIPADLPAHIARMMAEPAIIGQRSHQAYALVLAGAEWGLSDEEILAVASRHAPGTEKYGKALDREVGRMLGKARPDHRHEGQPCDRAGCPNRPSWMTGSGPAPGAGSSDSHKGSPERNTKRKDAVTEADDSADKPWPVLDPAALYGLAGDVVRAIDPFTEADPVAVLMSLLTGFGSAMGAGPAAVADGARHPGRLFVCVPGASAKARKGSATRRARQPLAAADPTWDRTRVMSGLSSGEGLIAQVADPPPTEDGLPPEPTDKRLFVIEEEFSKVLSVARREGSTLSAILRQAWDSGDLSVLTKQATKATGAHVSILGHITVEELRAKLTETDQVNGLANRFLFALARRSKRLPLGGDPDPQVMGDLERRLRLALSDARRFGTMSRSGAAEERWAALYDEMAEDDPGGLLGAIVARPEPQTLRLAVIYAALDGTRTIEIAHLEAAWAVWRYCRASAEYIFGDALGDEQTDKLLAAIRRSGQRGLTAAEQNDLFNGHVPAKRLEAMRQRLDSLGRVRTVSEDTGGRPRIVSYDAANAPEVGQ